MADPMQYTGYTYGSELYKQPTETMVDYMQRLAKQRAAGLLGGGGMLDTAEPITETDPVLGTVTQSCPAGFTLQNGACVRTSSYEAQDNTDLEKQQLMALGFTEKDVDQQRIADRLSGRRYAGQGLLYGIPYAISSSQDKEAAVKSITDAGYSKTEAQRIVDNPEVFSAMNANGLFNTKPTNQYSFYEGNQNDTLLEALGNKLKGVGESLGINDWLREQGIMDAKDTVASTDKVPLAPLALQGNLARAAMMAGQTFNTGDVGNIRTAQQTPYNPYPFADKYTKDLFSGSIVDQVMSTPAPSINNPRAIASSALSNALWQDAARQGMLSGAGSSAIDSYLSNLPPASQAPSYIQDTGSGITTSGSYDDSGNWSWSGTDFSAPAITSDGNDWNSW
jgi:hypothetical protein